MFQNISRNREVVEIDPKRLAYGGGDINGSYSADTLANHKGGGSVRKPFKFRGAEWVSVGGGGGYCECYRVVPRGQFDGPTVPYAKHSFAHDARDRLGGYHGMSAMQGGREIVLQGPPIIFAAGKPEQSELL